MEFFEVTKIIFKACLLFTVGAIIMAIEQESKKKYSKFASYISLTVFILLVLSGILSLIGVFLV